MNFSTKTIQEKNPVISKMDWYWYALTWYNSNAYNVWENTQK